MSEGTKEPSEDRVGGVLLSQMVQAQHDDELFPRKIFQNETIVFDAPLRMTGAVFNNCVIYIPKGITVNDIFPDEESEHIFIMNSSFKEADDYLWTHRELPIDDTTDGDHR